MDRLSHVSRSARRCQSCAVVTNSSVVVRRSVSIAWLLENYDRPGPSSSSSWPRVEYERPAHGALPPQGPSHPAETSERDRGKPREVDSSRPSSQRRTMDHWERDARQGRKRDHWEAGFDQGEFNLSSTFLFVTQLEAGHSLTSCHLNIAQVRRRNVQEGCEVTRCREVRPFDGRSPRSTATAGLTLFPPPTPSDVRGRRPAQPQNKVKGHRTGEPSAIGPRLSRSEPS